ncbi:hypothetical protein AGRA3207_007178 [Actinomadura graeca]|uniref:Uncharacterized protein n=1 Tax=Actinomadura graeca TaxID=2750812 RepID=A0ABX8R6T3_9ACTN|nr:hypothetical protein [Actinomadura graeca]QXJ25657.1 hypothetical protein AGRA3207_007178 [Actinomadura graeca]
MDEGAVPFLLARRYSVGERLILGPDGDAGHDLRRAVSRNTGRAFPADPRYRVVPYGSGHHAVYREIELTAADLDVPGPVRDEHGRAIRAIEGLAVAGEPSSVGAADLVAAHERGLRRYAELWRAERAERTPRTRPVPVPARPREPEPAAAPSRPVWIWIVPPVAGLALLLLVIILVR